MLEKKELRKYYSARAKELSKDYRDKASIDITHHVIASRMFIPCETIFVYVNKEFEPQTRAIIETAWRTGKRVCVPKCGKQPFMEAVEIHSWDDLAEGVFGLLEPVDGEVVPGTEIDVALVPCVSAYRDGARLGHGQGYYDVFLDNMKAIKMCLCFKELICDTIPMEEHDLRMDYLVTEDGIRVCRAYNGFPKTVPI